MIIEKKREKEKQLGENAAGIVHPPAAAFSGPG
jgi:hypothetical protein